MALRALFTSRKRMNMNGDTDMSTNTTAATNDVSLQRLMDGAKYNHSRQVSIISELLAKKAGLSPFERRVVSQAALLHDVGKEEIPRRILNKPAALTPEEFEIVKTHTAIGFERIAEAAQILTVAAVIAREHHEHENGHGYYHMTGTDIHPYAKLVAVADVFDALYSRRAYKDPWSVEKIRAYFTEQAGKQFDTDTVVLLFGILDEILPLYENKQ